MAITICTICREDFNDNRPPISTQCGHLFCSQCAASHFPVHPSCPSCRRPQSHSDLIRLYPEYESNDTGDVPSTSTRITRPPPMSTPPPVRDVSSLRIAIQHHPQFPWELAGSPVMLDKDHTPIFLGVVQYRNGMHPCKIRTVDYPKLWVSYDGTEYVHQGVSYILPYNPSTMEWVLTSQGCIPAGRHPVEGGYERDRFKLYHAQAFVQGVRLVGKTGEHLGCANIGFDGREYIIRDNYEILCWRD